MFTSRGCLLLVFMVMLSATLFAQVPGTEPENMVTSNGKLGVVIAVVVTLLVGLFLYLISLDRKISRLEKK
jgi:tetrahydromethanopterin S-methyltransferase subunit D